MVTAIIGGVLYLALVLAANYLFTYFRTPNGNRLAKEIEAHLAKEAQSDPGHSRF